MIKVENLTKRYAGHTAIQDLSFEVGKGEIMGFLGPNGAGKSTTMKMLMSLVYPTSGAMTLLGRPIGDVAVKRKVGFLPEQFRFHEWMQAWEFLDFHGQLYGMAARDRKRRIPEVLELVGLHGEVEEDVGKIRRGSDFTIHCDDEDFLPETWDVSEYAAQIRNLHQMCATCVRCNRVCEAKSRRGKKRAHLFPDAPFSKMQVGRLQTFARDVFHEVHAAVAVAPLVVVPAHKLEERAV